MPDTNAIGVNQWPWWCMIYTGYKTCWEYQLNFTEKHHRPSHHIPSLQVGLTEYSMINFWWPLCNNCPHNLWGGAGVVDVNYRCPSHDGMIKMCRARNYGLEWEASCDALMRDHLIWARCPSQIISALASMDTGGGLQRMGRSLDKKNPSSRLVEREDNRMSSLDFL